MKKSNERDFVLGILVSIVGMALFGYVMYSAGRGDFREGGNIPITAGPITYNVQPEPFPSYGEGSVQFGVRCLGGGVLDIGYNDAPAPHCREWIYDGKTVTACTYLVQCTYEEALE